MMQLSSIIWLAITSAVSAAGRVRDVNTQRNQVTIVTNKAANSRWAQKYSSIVQGRQRQRPNHSGVSHKGNRPHKRGKSSGGR